MIKVYTKLSSFENKGSLEGWIRRIIVNNAIDSLRTRKDYLLKEDQEFIINDLVDDSADETEMKRLKELKVEKIISLIQKLSPAYQMVFNLYTIENLSHKEIAEKLNINIGTSKSNLAKAKIRMKELVEQYWKEFMYE
jgi:RNA polymerase sigma factor (sigma-70 family)